MGIYAITGSASGIGHEAAKKLRAAGHTVIGVDVKQAEIVADLSSVEGLHAASKIAVSRWVRREAVKSDWAGAGIRLNALAPGAIMTPLLDEQLSTPKRASLVRSFPVPTGGFGDAGQLADWLLFMLSDTADFLCGSVVFVDGGTDAYFRPDDWPRPVPAYRPLSYAKRFRAGAGSD